MIRTAARSAHGYTKGAARVRSFLRPAGAKCSLSTGGAGIGNVHEQMLPSAFDEDKHLFKHCKHPRTASIIG